MRKKPSVNAKCAEVVKTNQMTQVSTWEVERERYEDEVRPERYQRKRSRLMQKLHQSKTAKLRVVETAQVAPALPAVSDRMEPVRLRRKPAPKQLHSLEALSYQARFHTLLPTRLEALEGLVMVDRSAERTLKTLEEALDDQEPEVRAKSAALLESFPTPLPETMLDKLIARVWDSELMVRRSVARTLANHPDPRAIGPLTGLLGSRDDELYEIVHNSLIEICTKLGPPPPRTDGDT